MKNNFKLNLKLVAFIVALTFTGVTNIKAQCTSIGETQVTNISQASAFVTFTGVSNIYAGGMHVGYKYTSGSTRGHRRSGGCCQFNGGFCGMFSSADLLTDLSGNITGGVYNMYIGTSEDEDYLRFEGIDEYND